MARAAARLSLDFTQNRTTSAPATPDGSVAASTGTCAAKSALSSSRPRALTASAWRRRATSATGHPARASMAP